MPGYLLMYTEMLGKGLIYSSLPLDSENPYDDTLLSLSKVSSNLQNTDSRSSSEELVTLSSKEKAPAHPFKEVCPTTPVTQP